MGFKKPLDYYLIHQQIRMAAYELNHRSNDGYTQWGIKQDLYIIKELIDDILVNSPTFAGEKEWLEQREKDKVIKILGK